MNKRIPLKDESFINLSNDDGKFVIDKGYTENGETQKVLTMSMGNDFIFEAYSFEDDDDNSITFSIPKYDPIYEHLNTLLGQDENLMIYDDMDKDNKEKFMVILKDEEYIHIYFENNTEDSDISNKFIITILNIVTDGTSLLDQEGSNTKLRFFNFFKNVRDELLLNK